MATLYLDTSGEGLYKRGYRARNMGAPLRETLAAALVTLSRYRGKDPFCDPFCGSGTIPIEAALIAKNRAPGLDRSFAAQKWKNMDSKLWLEAADEAMDKEFHGQYDIWGGDIDPAAVELAKHNAALAGVDDCIRFETADAGKFRRDSEYGQLVTNPPTVSVCWKRRKRRNCTGRSARLSGTCRPSGGCWCSVPTRSSSGASAAAPTKAQALQRHDQMRRIHVRKVNFTAKITICN